MPAVPPTMTREAAAVPSRRRVLEVRLGTSRTTFGAATSSVSAAVISRTLSSSTNSTRGSTSGWARSTSTVSSRVP